MRNKSWLLWANSVSQSALDSTMAHWTGTVVILQHVTNSPTETPVAYDISLVQCAVFAWLLNHGKKTSNNFPRHIWYIEHFLRWQQHLGLSTIRFAGWLEQGRYLPTLSLLQDYSSNQLRKTAHLVSEAQADSVSSCGYYTVCGRIRVNGWSKSLCSCSEMRIVVTDWCYAWLYCNVGIVYRDWIVVRR